MLSRVTFDKLLADVLAPVRDSSLALLVCDVTRPDLPVMIANDAFSELTGQPAGDVIGRGLGALDIPATEPGAILRLVEAARRGAPATITLGMQRRDGTWFLCEVSAAPVRDQAGLLRYCTLLHREVAGPLHGAPGGARVRFALQPGLGLVPLPVAGGMPMDWLERVPRNAHGRLTHAAQVCAGRGTSLSVGVKLADAGGHEAEMTLQAHRVPDPAQPDALVFEGTFAPQSSAARLATRLHLLEAVMANANDAIVVTEAEPFDPPGPRILYVNEAITRQTGYQPEQMLGRSPRMLQGRLTDQAEVARFGAALRRWERVTATLLNYRADGTTFWNEISCTPIADEHGWWTYWIAIQRDITDRKEVAEKVAFLANHDPLTGLANRRLAGGRLEEGLRRAASERGACGVVKIDLDRFKPINDTYGHAAGDAVLAEVANRLTAAARGSDTVARIGGDEFLVVLPGLGTRPDLEAAAARFLASITGPFRWNGKKLAIEGSVGAALHPEDGDEPDGLLAAADIALYRAKARGRGRAHVFSEELRAETAEVRQVGEDLHDAIERDEFEAHFQPKIRLRDRRLVGFEALVRWRHPRKGLLPPPAFLAVAEASGLMRTIDTRVLRSVARVAAGWSAMGLDFGRISVNASADSFAEPGFVAGLSEAMDRAGMNPAHLAVEVVESIFISERAGGVIGKLDELRRLGIRIELDDFGTGYAALAHLRAFKVDGIKLDRSFVRGVGADREDEIITGAIVGLARNLGIGCVAEGVETEAQAAFLRDLGCDSGQGYLFGKPLDEAGTTSWLRELRGVGMVLPLGGCLVG